MLQVEAAAPAAPPVLQGCRQVEVGAAAVHAVAELVPGPQQPLAVLPAVSMAVQSAAAATVAAAQQRQKQQGPRPALVEQQVET